MKQSAAKTLGVAALGAAFAAAGAGAANAAPAVPDAAETVGTVGSMVPMDTVTKALPGAADPLTHGQSAVGSGVRAAQPVAESVLAKSPTGPVSGLLGGMPPQGETLPTHGLPLNGIPLG